MIRGGASSRVSSQAHGILLRAVLCNRTLVPDACIDRRRFCLVATIVNIPVRLHACEMRWLWAVTDDPGSLAVFDGMRPWKVETPIGRRQDHRDFRCQLEVSATAER